MRSAPFAGFAQAVSKYRVNHLLTILRAFERYRHKQATITIKITDSDTRELRNTITGFGGHMDQKTERWIILIGGADYGTNLIHDFRIDITWPIGIRDSRKLLLSHSTFASRLVYFGFSGL